MAEAMTVYMRLFLGHHNTSIALRDIAGQLTQLFRGIRGTRIISDDPVITPSLIF